MTKDILIISLARAVIPLILLAALCIGEPDILDGIIKRVNNMECIKND